MTRPVRAASPLLHGLFGLLHLRNDVLRMREECLAAVGQRDMPRASDEQVRAEAALEGGNLPAERGLRHEQSFRRLREAAVLGNGQRRAQVPGIHAAFRSVPSYRYASEGPVPAGIRYSHVAWVGWQVTGRHGANMRGTAGPVEETEMGTRREDVWSALVDNRERAMRVALARCGSRDEVDDCVQEAMTRVAGMPDVDVARVGQLLTAVVSNLAVDAHRTRSRASRNMHRVVPPPPPGPDEAVCDIAEARWLWEQRATLDDRDRRVLDLRLAERSVGEAARELGITYKSAEHALARARGCLKAAWRATAVLAGILCGSRLRRAGTAPALALSPAALTLVMVLAIGATGALGSNGNVSTERMTRKDVVWSSLAEAAPAPPRVASMRVDARGQSSGPTRRRAPSPNRTLARTPELVAGGVRVGSRPVTHNSEDETVLESAERCLRDGPIVTTTYVGCPK
jgi:RNA polymerase sigma factor (sigma-70 family)